MIPGIEILGFVSGNFDFDLPEGLAISGYITNKGTLYNIYEKVASPFSLFDSAFLTEEQVRAYCNKIQRKEKLNKINEI